MFDNRSGMVPKFADANDQANFDEHFRKDVEAVATGQCEKTVAILPLRDTYTRGRAVVFNRMEEVEEYRRQTGPEWWDDRHSGPRRLAGRGSGQARQVPASQSNRRSDARRREEHTTELQ